jgi:hypothetical protein
MYNKDEFELPSASPKKKKRKSPPKKGKVQAKPQTSLKKPKYRNNFKPKQGSTVGGG